MLVSVRHLGRKTRAWRAVLNVRRSWLSREIAGFEIFMGLSALALLFKAPALGWAGALVGFLALFAMDRVYDPVRARTAKPLHSADVLVTGLLMAGILAREPWLAGAAALLKAGLYVRRRAGVSRRDRLALDLLRLGAGLFAPAVVWLARPQPGLFAVFALALIAEAADRRAFYLELEVPTPRRQAERDLAGLLARPNPGRS